jgi:acetyltransferase-like isoleucine patch superfamily enzyme
MPRPSGRGTDVLRGALSKACDVLAKQVPANELRIRLQRAKGVKIGQHVYLGYDVIIDPAMPWLVEIEDHVRISHGVIILAHMRPGDAWLEHLGEEQGAVRIQRHAALYAGSIIQPGVTIGECAIVRAGAVVEASVPPFTVVAGVPARVVAELPRDKVRAPTTARVEGVVSA